MLRSSRGLPLRACGARPSETWSTPAHGPCGEGPGNSAMGGSLGGARSPRPHCKAVRKPRQGMIMEDQWNGRWPSGDMAGWIRCRHYGRAEPAPPRGGGFQGGGPSGEGPRMTWWVGFPEIPLLFSFPLFKNSLPILIPPLSSFFKVLTEILSCYPSQFPYGVRSNASVSFFQCVDKRSYCPEVFYFSNGFRYNCPDSRIFIL